jgi:transcriptional regulator with XRE-family HTH domain
MSEITSHRGALGISQSKLARLSGVSRFRLNAFELGGGNLTPAEEEKIASALHAEAERLRNYLGAVARVAQHGADATDPREAQAAATILVRDVPRGLEAGGRPSYQHAAGDAR